MVMYQIISFKQIPKIQQLTIDKEKEQKWHSILLVKLDRIDSSKGYIRGNVRYISVSVNWLKNELDDNHVREFIQICNGSKLIF